MIRRLKETLSHLKLSHKGLILVAVPLALELVFISTLFGLLNEAEIQAKHAERSRAIVTGAEELTRLYYNAGTALVLWGVAHDPSGKGRYDNIVTQIPEQFRLMEELVADNPDQMQTLRNIEETGNKGLRLLDHIRETLESGRHKPFVFLQFPAARREMLETVASLSGQLREFVKPEAARQDENEAAKEQARTNVKLFLALGVVLHLIIALGVAVYFFRSVVRRLSVLTNNSRLLADNKPLRPLIGGQDEIAELDVVFHQMADKLSEVAQLKKDFAAMISHDLRTPLSSLQNLLALLSRKAYGDLNETGTQRVSTAEKDITRLVNLINELLDLEKMEAGKLQLHVEPTDLDELIVRSIGAVEGVAAKRHVEVKYSDTPAVVSAEADRIVQVLVNLLSNAIKYSPERGVVTVRVKEVDRMARVSITDEGQGIDESAQQAIFERFKQAKAEDTKKGTGLGLPIAKAFIEAHGGTIGVTSAPGQGSTFYFTLPLDEEYLKEDAENMAEAQMPA
jgi:signal transduction histidine kinase